MKITFVLPFAGLTGGVRVVGIYARHLRARGHEVTVVSTPQPRRNLEAKLRYLVRRGSWPAPLPGGDAYFRGVEHRVIERCRPITDDDVPDADVVVATWWETAHWVHALSPRKGVKVYFVQDYGGPGQELDAVAATWTLPMHLITISRFIADLVRRYTDAPVDVVPNGVDRTLFHAPARGKQRRPTFGLVYARPLVKGADLALGALSIAQRRRPDLRVVGFGPCPPVRTMRHPILESGDFRWAIGDEELADVYRRCDAWLFGTRREGFGLPILEAMACRTPVIATPAGAAPELLASGGGWLVPHEDPTAMARAILDVCDMPESPWRAYSDAADATAAAYTWPASVDRFEQSLSRARDNRHARSFAPVA